MAQPSFRLATLLKLRQMVRDQRRQQLAEAFEAEARIDDRLSELAGQLQQLESQHRAQCGAGPLDVDRMLDTGRYQLILKIEQQSVEQEKATLAAVIDERRQALVAADQEVRSLELLRERQQERYALWRAQQETKELDEAAGLHHRRREAS